MLRVGLSANFFYRDPKRALFKDKTLVYAEESLLHWIAEAGALPILLPTLPLKGKFKLSALVKEMHGLVLAGGSDVSPGIYGEEPLKPEWGGDEFRDRYELALVKEFRRQKKPVLGICRGAQLLNVAFGGTLYQDIATQLPASINHRNWEIYDKNFHDVIFEKGSLLQKTYPKVQVAKVCTVHHQGVKEIGKGLRVEAISLVDGVVEAIAAVKGPYLFALQWHPEFHDPADKSLLDSGPVLAGFLREASRGRRK